MTVHVIGKILIACNYAMICIALINELKYKFMTISFLNSNIVLPVIPNGLQIMADQGFPRMNPLLIPARNNRNNLPARIRRLVMF